MNYQQVLSISYVFHLVNLLLNDPMSHETNHYKIVKMEDTFYLQDYNKNLKLIQESAQSELLNTFIYFEKNKKNPITGFINLRTQQRHRQIKIDYELLKNLQIQYATDKSYFNDENFNLLLPE
jgi:hypothetical protein